VQFKSALTILGSLWGLFLAVWIIVDMVTDALQSKTYHELSPYWNLDHEAHANWTSKVDRLCGDLEGLGYDNVTGPLARKWADKCTGPEDKKYTTLLGFNHSNVEDSEIGDLAVDILCLARQELNDLHPISLCAPRLSKWYFIGALASWLISPVLVVIFGLVMIKKKFEVPLRLKINKLKKRIKDTNTSKLAKLGSLGCLGGCLCGPIFTNFLAYVLSMLLFVGFLIIYIFVPINAVLRALTDLKIFPSISSENNENMCKICIQAYFNMPERAIKRSKFFETLGEAIPQLVLSLIFYVNNKVYIDQDGELFSISSILVTQTTLSIFFSIGSILMTVATSLQAGIIKIEGARPEDQEIQNVEKQKNDNKLQNVETQKNEKENQNVEK